jgi:lipopolysaccharide export system permease protein
VLYVNEIDNTTKTLRDVFIEDQRNGRMVSTVVAHEGKLFKDPDKSIFQLRLYDGTIHRVEVKTRSVHSINFDTYDINLDVQRVVAQSEEEPKDEKEMSVSELRQFLKTLPQKDTQYYVALIELHRKFSIPFACVALGFLAVPLGMQSKTTRRSFGIGLGLIFFLFYYLLLSAGWVFGETGMYPPAIGMWVPNGVMVAIGGFLFKRTQRERPVDIRNLLKFLKWFTPRCRC